MEEENQSLAITCDDTLQRVPLRELELDRFKFGKRKYYQIALSSHNQLLNCLDVACGAKPFPKADVLCDLNVKPVADRSMKSLETCGKPFVLCNCCFLPFKEKAFDFVTSYYLVEHIDDPSAFFRELKRVSKHGFVQCPTWFNELLYGEKVHNWIVLKRGKRLFIRAIGEDAKWKLNFGFVFHRLYKLKRWQLLHAIIDETFHIFTLKYDF
jgi:SAM-dependent methyltransferase